MLLCYAPATLCFAATCAGRRSSCSASLLLYACFFMPAASYLLR